MARQSYSGCRDDEGNRRPAHAISKLASRFDGRRLIAGGFTPMLIEANKD
jgi:hypothetical protein